ncbi:hypothetical protein ABTX60_05085 [Streptomyces sp. NPDC126510]|uniref:hypothetical protein n=1 Tax=Streptomyces sp. NPDC126510 TaxID=3155317 RepID=UPI0033235584
MNSTPYMIDDSARSRDAEVWFALPPGFLALPLLDLAEAASGPAEGARPGNVLLPLLEGISDPEDRQEILLDFAPVQQMAKAFLESGAIHCSLGLHVDDEGDGGLLLSLFTVTWRATNWAPRNVIATRAAAGNERAERIESLALSCGPASLVQERLTAPSESGLVGRDLIQITAYVPCPDAARVTALTLATAAVGRAQHYCALLRDIAQTVTFDNPLPDVSDED